MLTKLLTLSMMLGSISVYANQVNMSDNLDKNVVPSEQEERKKVEEPRNLPDQIDRNTVPAPFEERQKEEEAIDQETLDEYPALEDPTIEDESTDTM